MDKREIQVASLIAIIGIAGASSAALAPTLFTGYHKEIFWGGILAVLGCMAFLARAYLVSRATAPPSTPVTEPSATVKASGNARVNLHGGSSTAQRFIDASDRSSVQASQYDHRPK